MSNQNNQEQGGFYKFICRLKRELSDFCRTLLFLQLVVVFCVYCKLGMANIDIKLVLGVGLLSAASIFVYAVSAYLGEDKISRIYQKGRWQIKHIAIAIIFPLLAILVPIGMITGKSTVPITSLAGVALGETFVADDSWERTPSSIKNEVMYHNTDETQPHIKTTVRVYNGIVYRIDMKVEETEKLGRHRIKQRLIDKLETRYGSDRWFENINAWYDGRHVLVLRADGVYAYVDAIHSRITNNKRQNEELSLDVKLDRYLGAAE